MHLLITAGGTRVPIDDVRSIANRSTGRFGAAIARAALLAGHRVTLLRADDARSPATESIDLRGPIDSRLAAIRERADRFASCWDRFDERLFGSLGDYRRLLEELIRTGRPDAVVLAAAVSDYAPTPQSGKISSAAERLTLALSRTEKAIDLVKSWDASVRLIGFKLLSRVSRDELIAAAKRLAERTGCNLVVANDLASIEAGDHTVHLVQPGREVETVRSADDPAFAVVRRIDELGPVPGRPKTPG